MRAFRDQVLEIMRRKFPDARARPGPDDGSISVESAIFNLDNIYATAHLLPVADREAAVVDFVARLLESRDRSRTAKDIGWVEAKGVLRARLVPVHHFPPDAEILRRPFSPGVVVGYAIDHGRQVRFASRSDRAQWKVKLDQIHEAAVANLESLSEAVPLEISEARGGGRFLVVDTNDSYDAARLVLPRFRGRLLAALGEPIFVGIPNRDFLVAWSANNAQFVQLVARVVEDFGQQPYPITDRIFHVDRQGVRPATASERRGR